MKKAVFFGVFFFSVLAVFGAGKFEVSDIRMEYRVTPIPKYLNLNSSTKVSHKTNWLTVSCSFIPEAIPDGAEQWYDDVTMEGVVVITRGVSPKETSYAVLLGETRFFTIPADGKKHYGVLFVPPQIIARYCGTLSGNGRSIRMARMSFYGPGRVLLGEAYWASDTSGKKGKVVNSDDKQYRQIVARMKEFEKNYSNVIRLRGALYSKEKTPWALFDFDFYDLIYDHVLQSENSTIKK